MMADIKVLMVEKYSARETSPLRPGLAADRGHSAPSLGIQSGLQSLVLFQHGLLECGRGERACIGTSAARRCAESVLMLMLEM